MNDAKAWYKENKENYNLYNDTDEMVIDAFEAGQQQYKSIVKQVDPDNLPDHEVWVWCEAGLSFGEIFMSRVFKQLIVDSKYGNYRNPTHYIEQDDLIKLFK